MTPVLLRRLHLETSQTTYLFNHTTLSLLFLQLPINQSTNHIYGYKDNLACRATTSVSQSRLYICDVKAPLLGLHDIFDSGIILHINGKDCSTIEHHGETEPLYHHRSHLFIDAMAFDIDHKIHQHWVHYIQQHGFDSDRCILMNDIEDPLGEAEKTSVSTLTHSYHPQAEQDAHALDTSAIPVLVLGVPAGERPRRPTSPATSGRERQHHTA